MTLSSLSANRPRLVAANRPPAATGAVPAVRAKAQGRDPLPSFKGPDDYKNYVINLVGQAQGAERELEVARKDLNQGKEGTRLVIATLQERLDAIKLQLKILRDDYPIPSDWTRSKLLFGQGFDKDKFWKEQVEVIPGQEVVIPRPAPAPAKPKPAPEQPRPAAPAAPADPAPAVNGSGDLSAPLAKLLVGYATEGLAGNDNSAGNAFMRGKLNAMLPILAGKADSAARDAEAFVSYTLKSFDGNYATSHAAYRAAFGAVKELIGGTGTLQERHDRAIAALVAEGANANDNSAGNSYARSRVIAIQKHAEQGTDERSKQIAALAARVRREYDGNYSTSHHAYKATFASVKALLSNEGTLDTRKRGVIGDLARAGLTANDNSAGNTYARAELQAIMRLTEGSADAALQAVDGLVRETLRKHDGNYSATHNAYVSTFQAVQAMLA